MAGSERLTEMICDRLSGVSVSCSTSQVGRVANHMRTFSVLRRFLEIGLLLPL